MNNSMGAAVELKGKRILVVGMAASGIASALFLRQRGALVAISEMRAAAEMRHELPALLEAGVAIETGGHRERSFLDADLIVVSPGVPFDLPALVVAREHGVTVWGEIELASRYLRGTLVAITGANGKTTTTALTGAVLAGCGRRVQVGGNIGVPLITLVESSSDDCVNVAEVSSFQLETIASFHPHVAAVLNLSPDHLDRHGSMAAYAAAKQRIFMNQTAGDFAVLNHRDSWCRRFASSVAAAPVWFDASFDASPEPAAGTSIVNGEVVYTAEGARHAIMPVAEIPLRGAHNLDNVLAAVAMACLIESPQAAPKIREAVRAFKAVEHRLEFVARVGGVEYYNDSKATNVDATVKALEAFAGGVWLILGGKDKGSDYTPLAPLLRQRGRGALLIGAATEKIAQHLQADEGVGVPMMVRCGTLERAVAHAHAHAQPGDTVLLAPACSSFDQFRNFGHRGQVFKELVAALALAG